MATKSSPNLNAQFNVGEESEAEPTKPKTYKIFIDEVEGLPNFEVVGVNGNITQIQRGVEVEVSAAVVGALRTAVKAVYVEQFDRDQGKNILVERKQSSIPWRIVG